MSKKHHDEPEFETAASEPQGVTEGLQVASHDAALLRIPAEEIDRVVGSVVNAVMATVGSLKNGRGERARFNFDQNTLRADVAKIVDRMIFTDMEEKNG